MNWFVWRQHRKQFLVMGIILALFAALIVPTGLHFWHAYQQTLVECKQNPANPTCSNLSANLFSSNIDSIFLRLVPVALLFLPMILGIFWGAPLLAKEYAEGTNSLAWTQSVSRRKWLTVKLAWLLVATAVFMAAFAALLTWWSKTPNTLDNNRFNQLPFVTQGIVPVAFGIFTVACGILFGAWFRKTMAAIGVLLALFVVTAIVMPNFVRAHYMSPITVTAPMGPGTLDSKLPRGAYWLLTRTIVDGNGKAVGDIFPAAPAQCQQIIQQNQVGTGSGTHVKAIAAVAGDPIDACLNKAGWHQVAKYQPGYRYWDFQEIESGIYLGLTAIAIGATYWLVIKRDA